MIVFPGYPYGLVCMADDQFVDDYGVVMSLAADVIFCGVPTWSVTALAAEES